MQRHVGLLVAILIGCASLARAQDTTGTVTGRIVDSQELADSRCHRDQSQARRALRKPQRTVKAGSACHS